MAAALSASIRTDAAPPPAARRYDATASSINPARSYKRPKPNASRPAVAAEGPSSSSWAARAGPHGTAPFAIAVVVLCIAMNTNWSASKQGWLMFAYAAASRTRSRQRDQAFSGVRFVHPRLGAPLS